MENMTLFCPSPLSICFSGNLIGKSLQMGTAEWHVGHLLWASITPTLHITPPHFLIPSSAFRSSPSPQLLCPSLGTAGLAHLNSQPSGLKRALRHGEGWRSWNMRELGFRRPEFLSQPCPYFTLWP